MLLILGLVGLLGFSIFLGLVGRVGDETGDLVLLFLLFVLIVGRLISLLFFNYPDFYVLTALPFISDDFDWLTADSSFLFLNDYYTIFLVNPAFPIAGLMFLFGSYSIFYKSFPYLLLISSFFSSI